MRLFSALLLIFGLALAPSAFAAQKQGARAPAKTPDKPAERIYLESEVHIDEVYQFATDQEGFSLSGTIQSFYPNGRLAWATQWVNGKLHGVTRGYYENRQLREETTWMNGKLNGLARWYDEKGQLLRETMYEDDQDLAAPRESQEQEAPVEQQEAPVEQDAVKETPAEQDKAPKGSP